MRSLIFQFYIQLLFGFSLSSVVDDSVKISLDLRTTGCDHSCVFFSDGAKCPSSILVNGSEKSRRKDGFNVAVIDNFSGHVQTASFRWFSRMSVVEWKTFRDYFKKIHLSSTVVVVFQNMCKLFDSKWFTLLSSHAGLEISHIIRSQYNYDAAILIACKHSCPKVIQGQIPFTYFGIRDEFTLKTIEFVLNNECSLPLDAGGCKGNFKRFYYNKVGKKCKEFVYGGCNGNGNNFEMLKDCVKKCEVEDESITKVQKGKGGIGGILGGIITIICIIAIIVIVLNVYKQRTGEINWQYFVACCSKNNESVVATYNTGNSDGGENQTGQNNPSDEHIYECISPRVIIGNPEQCITTPDGIAADILRDGDEYYDLSNEDTTTYSVPAETLHCTATNDDPDTYNHLSTERFGEDRVTSNTNTTNSTYDSLMKGEAIYEPLAESCKPGLLYQALSAKDPGC